MSDHRSDPTIPRELALRLLTPRFWADTDPDQIRLLVGQLPDAWPAAIPLPDHSQLLGSLMRNPRMIEVVIDSALVPDDVLQFFRDQLSAAGWTEPKVPRHMGGFTHGYSRPSQGALFCLGKRGPSLEINVAPTPDGSTDVRLHLNSDPHHSPCGSMNRGREIFDLLPTLAPPSGAQQQGGGGGGGSDSVYSSATLESNLDLATIATHYADQLNAAQWTPVASGGDSTMAWSTWTWQDDEGDAWQGLFFVVRWGGSGRYFLEVHLRSDADDGGLAGQIGIAFG